MEDIEKNSGEVQSTKTMAEDIEGMEDGENTVGPKQYEQDLFLL